MVHVKEISVLDKYSLDGLYVTFKIEDTSEDLDNYKFDLHRSDSPLSGFTEVVSDIKDFLYKDTSVNLFDMSIDYYYKVEVTDKNTGEVSMSDVYGEYRGRQPDGEAATMIYMNNVYLESVVKRPVLLLKRKHTGQICSCYNDVRRRADSVNCHSCFGTRYVGGYHTPHEIYINIMNAPAYSEKMILSDEAEDESPFQVWTSNFPKIQVNDILINSDNTRFIVMFCQESTKNGCVVRQVLQMQRIPKSNIVYQFAIPK